MSNIIYCAEWDGRANWLTVHKGNIADLKLAYMGWPMVASEEEYIAACEAQAVIDAESAIRRAAAEEAARIAAEEQEPPL